MDVINYLLKLVILALPLFAIPALLKSSNSMLGRIYGTAQNLGSKFTGGAKETAGKRANLAKMETRAMRADAGFQRDGAGNLMRGPDGKPLHSGRRRDVFRNRLGGGSAWSEQRLKNREKEASRVLEDSVLSDMQANPERYVGVGHQTAAEARVAATVAGMGKERFNEALKLEEARLSTKSTEQLADILREAIQSGSQETAYAASSLLNAKGGPGTAKAGEVVSDMLSSGLSQESTELAAGIVKSNGKEFNGADPSLTKFADQTLDGSQKSYSQIAQESSTYTGASPEKMATWTPDTIERAHRVVHGAGPAEFAKIQQQSYDLLNSRYAENLSPEQKAYHQKIASGQAP